MQVVTAVDITPNANHPTVTELAGYSIRADSENPINVCFFAGSADGQRLACPSFDENEAQTEFWSKVQRAPAGVYVKVVNRATGEVAATGFDVGVLYAA